jgi:hypothetical protein
MAGLALTILVIVALITMGTWMSFGSSASYDQALSQAEHYAEQARQATGQSDQRDHWQAVLTILADIGAEEDPRVAALLTEAQQNLDRLDGVIRVEPDLLWLPGTAVQMSRIVAHQSTVFMLDLENQSVINLNLIEAGENTSFEAPAILTAGEVRDGNQVGGLVDIAWNRASGEWVVDCLVILDASGQLWVYDVAWPDNTYALPLGTPPGGGMPRAIETFEGRLYLLDPDARQVWRYPPHGGGYPSTEPYFPSGAPQSLEWAHDLAIDGNIYVLMAEGTLAKYFGGDPAVFEVRDVPPPTPRFVAIAVDPELTGRIYLADSAADRLVILNEDGAFRAQLRATQGEFSNLQAIALDSTTNQILVLTEDGLYAFPIPTIP